MGTTVIASCSFCGHSNAEVGTLVAGPGVFICDACVGLCTEVIAAKEQLVPGTRPLEHPLAPWELDASLDVVLAGLGPVAAAGEQADRNLHAWVHKARALGGTWAQIGEALGMTRQSAWERFAPGD